MSRPDAGLRKLIHSNLGKPDWTWAAIETGASAAGLPDSHFLHRPTGSCGWVESKRADHWAVKFEAHQIQFWRLHGPHVRGFIFVRASGAAQTDARGDGLYVYRGVDCEEVDRVGLRLEPLLRLVGSSRSWDWSAVQRVLLS